MTGIDTDGRVVARNLNRAGLVHGADSLDHQEALGRMSHDSQLANVRSSAAIDENLLSRLKRRQHGLPFDPEPVTPTKGPGGKFA